MSFTRLAGAWSSAGFLAKRTLPLASSRRTDSALSAGRRPFCAHAGVSPAPSASDKLRRRIPTRTAAQSTRDGPTGPRENAPRVYLTARLSSFEGLKRGMRPPDTFIGWPVRGFLPFRGLRRAIEKVPKPTTVTGCPRLSDVRTAPRSARRERSAAAFVHPLAAAIEVTRSARVIIGLLSAPSHDRATAPGC